MERLNHQVYCCNEGDYRDDGVEYPLVKMEISNSSHPFYTGKIKLIDTAGRVDKFMNRYKNHMENRKK